MANLQSRIHSSPSKNLSWIRPGYEPPKKSHQDQFAENEQTVFVISVLSYNISLLNPSSDATLQERYRRSRPSTGMSSVPLLDRIQMDREETGVEMADTGQAEKSLIERIGIAPDDKSARLYQSTSLRASRQVHLDQNDKSINGNIEEVFASSVRQLSVGSLFFLLGFDTTDMNSGIS